MPRSRVSVADVDFDLEAPKVASVKFDKHDVIVKLDNVAVPGCRTSSILLRFEWVEDFEAVSQFLTIRVERSYLKAPGLAKPILHEKQVLAPLALPARLTRLEEVKGPPGKRTVAFALDEPRFRNRKKPLLITCKRLVITNASGKPIAGDPSPSRTSAKKWRPKDFREFAARFADAVEKGDYATVHELCDDPLRKRRSVRRIETEFNRWKAQAPIPKEARSNARRLYQIDLDDAENLIDLIPPGLDPEICRARCMIGFIGRFGVSLILVDGGGALRVGSYEIDRDWD